LAPINFFLQVSGYGPFCASTDLIAEEYP
jgi:hypothetical protein